MRKERLSYQELLRRLITSGVLTSEEALIASGVLTLSDPTQMGWRVLSLLERLAGRGVLRPLAPTPGDPRDVVRYLDPCANHYYALLLPTEARLPPPAAETEHGAESSARPAPDEVAPGTVHAVRTFGERITEDIEETDAINRQDTQTPPRCLAVLLVDLDRWKDQPSDRAAWRRKAEHVARTIQCQLRGLDWTSEEEAGHSAVVLKPLMGEVIGEKTARWRAELIRHNVSATASEAGVADASDRGVTVSIGFALYPEREDPDRRNWQDLLECARAALLHAKKCGGDQVVSWKELRREG